MRRLELWPLLCLPLAGCSLNTLALHSTAGLLDKGTGALYEEPDPDFARESMGPQLKLVEALLQNEPDNARLLALSAEGFGGYSFLFFEDAQPERARAFYLRGLDYGLRATSLPRDPAGLEAALKARGKEDVPALFWTAFCWAGWINLSKDDSSAVAELPMAVAVMRRVQELEPGYHFDGPDLFFGAYYASRPAILGGSVAKAKDAFAEAERRTQGKFLMTYVLEAKYLAVAAQDRELFKSLLEKVQQGMPGALPGARLSDEMARRKAHALMEKIDDYF